MARSLRTTALAVSLATALTILASATDAKTLANPNLVPAKYGEMSKEILVHTIASGPNTYDILLEP